MKKKVIALSAMIIGGLAVFSCNKKTITPPISKSNQTPIAMFASAGFEFDSVGAAHNGYLRYVYGNPNFENMSEEEIYQYGEGYIDPNFGGMPNVPYSSVLRKVNYAISVSDNLILNDTDPTNKLLHDELIDTAMVPYCHTLANILSDAADTINHSPYSPAQFNSIIGNLEQTIANNMTVTMEYDSVAQDYVGNDGAMLLAACAVAKYSYNYWYNDALGSTGNVMMPMGLGGFIHRAWNGIKVAGADVYGFIVSGDVTVTVKSSGVQPMIGDPNVGGSIKWNLKDAIHNAGVTSEHQKENNK